MIMKNHFLKILIMSLVMNKELTYKNDLTYLGWISKDITNSSLDSILTLIEI